MLKKIVSNLLLITTAVLFIVLFNAIVWTVFVETGKIIRENGGIVHIE